MLEFLRVCFCGPCGAESFFLSGVFSCYFPVHLMALTTIHDLSRADHLIYGRCVYIYMLGHRSYFPVKAEARVLVMLVGALLLYPKVFKGGLRIIFIDKDNVFGVWEAPFLRNTSICRSAKLFAQTPRHKLRDAWRGARNT